MFDTESPAASGLALDNPDRLSEAEREQAPKPQAFTLPTAIDHVIHERRNRLYQIRSIVAGAFAIAEANDDCSETRYALEIALDLFEQAIESLEPLVICADALEVSHG